MNLSCSKKTLVIGSAAVDVILRVPLLPSRGGDANITEMSHRAGGCAYNVFKALKKTAPEIGATLCSPVGSGAYGNMVREQFAKDGIRPFVELEEENGCCYCIVEEDGERTFLSRHGAEYRFSRAWFKKPWRDSFCFSDYDSVYISGIDLEDAGDEIAAFACEHPELEAFFSPGPRFSHIPQNIIEMVFSRNPVLHLNEAEACALSARGAAEAAAECLAARTGNAVVVTLGGYGCFYFNPCDCGDASLVPALPVQVSNTVGAGDAHCGALIAALKSGRNLREACALANRIAAEVVAGAD